MLFAKRTYGPTAAAEATIGQSGRDIAGLIRAVAQQRQEPQLESMVDVFRPWSEYMKALAAITLSKMHDQIAEVSQEYLDNYVEAMQHHLNHARDVERLQAELDDPAWLNDVMTYIDQPPAYLARLVTRKIIKRSPLFKDNAELILAYCDQRLEEADNGLSEYTYKL